jgi:hypothetical protein
VNTVDELTRAIRRAVAVQAVMMLGDDRDKAALAGLLTGEADDGHARFMRAWLDVIAGNLFGAPEEVMPFTDPVE